MTSVEFSPAARRDLSAIFAFTERRFGRSQADRYVSNIARSCTLVAAGRRGARTESHILAGLFSHRSGSHRIYHRQGPGGSLLVVRILHGAMNHEDHF